MILVVAICVLGNPKTDFSKVFAEPEKEISRLGFPLCDRQSQSKHDEAFCHISAQEEQIGLAGWGRGGPSESAMRLFMTAA